MVNLAELERIAREEFADPRHYYREREESVVESFLPAEAPEAVRAFLAFCREVILVGRT